MKQFCLIFSTLLLFNCSNDTPFDPNAPPLPLGVVLDARADGVALHLNAEEKVRPHRVIRIGPKQEEFIEDLEAHEGNNLLSQPPPGRYHYQVTARSKRRWYAGKATLIIAPRTLKAHGGTIVSRSGLFPAIADLNGDGKTDLLGAFNQGAGEMATMNLKAQGLEQLIQTQAGKRKLRDNRLADLDNDGDFDLICNGYSEPDDPTGITLLFWNDGSGRFTADSAFNNKQLTGFGETILTFDYDNDADIDLFIPYYAHPTQKSRCYLLQNQGDGSFRDVTEHAGVSLAEIPSPLRVEGAQAADINDDGWIDFYIASHLFINRGDGKFLDVRRAARLPVRFDEGFSFLDWNADGKLDLVMHHPFEGPLLYERTSHTLTRYKSLIIPRFSKRNLFPSIAYNKSYGLKVADLNNDGLPDISIGVGMHQESYLFVNTRDRYQRNSPSLFTRRYDIVAFADFDADNRVNILRKEVENLVLQQNTTQLSHTNVFWIKVLGKDGLYNQQGRVVRAYAQANPNFVITRVVESGSGFLSQSAYECHMALPYPGPYQVTVAYPNHPVSFSIQPSSSVEVRPNGQVTPYALPSEKQEPSEPLSPEEQ